MTCAERSPLVNDIGNRPSVRATLRREQSIAQSPPIKNEKRTVSNTEGGITCGFSGSSRIAILMGMAGRDAIIYHLTVKRTKFRTCSFAMEYKVNAFVTCLLHCVVHSLLVSLRIFDSICNARCGPTKVTIILPFLQKLWLHARIGFL